MLTGPIGRQTLCINRTSYGTADGDQGCFGTALAWDISALYKIHDGVDQEGPIAGDGEALGDGDGIGGLGHMAIQFASKLGLEAVVFSSTESKKQEALNFGASEFHATKNVESWDSIRPLDILIITTSVNTNLPL